jgi:trigger factor
MTLPALNDEFAQTVSEGKQQTLLEYRMKVREDLQAEMDRMVENAYAEEALDLLTEGADMAYPEIMVQEYIDEILKELENNLQERGLSLDQFLALEKTNKENLRATYRDLAMRRLERSLALGSLVANEQLTVTDEDVDQAIDRMLENLGDQAATFRKLFSNEQSRSNIAMDLIKDRALARLTRIMKGEAPPLPAPVKPDALTAPEEPGAGSEDKQAEPAQAEPANTSPADAQES